MGCNLAVAGDTRAASLACAAQDRGREPAAPAALEGSGVPVAEGAEQQGEDELFGLSESAFEMDLDFLGRDAPMGERFIPPTTLFPEDVMPSAAPSGKGAHVASRLQ